MSEQRTPAWLATVDGLPGWVENPDVPNEWTLVGGADWRDDPVTLSEVHPPDRCIPPCALHSPTGHHMRGWPIIWDGFVHLPWRNCGHGDDPFPVPGSGPHVHPDPDAERYMLADPRVVGGVTGAHRGGCDGCCLLTDALRVGKGTGQIRFRPADGQVTTLSGRLGSWPAEAFVEYLTNFDLPARPVPRLWVGGDDPDGSRPFPVRGCPWPARDRAVLLRWVTGRAAVHGLTLDQELLDDATVMLGLASFGDA